MSRVFVSVGGNLPHPRHGPPGAVLAAAMTALPDRHVRVAGASGLYCTAPVPVSDQPDCLNAVLELEAAASLDPHALLQRLQALEASFGRQRGQRNAARVLDLDLLAWGARLIDDARLSLPHPRLHERAFVLVPLAELAPEWRHPRLQRSVTELVAMLAPGQRINPANPEDSAAWCAARATLHLSPPIHRAADAAH